MGLRFGAWVGVCRRHASGLALSIAVIVSPAPLLAQTAVPAHPASAPVAPAPIPAVRAASDDALKGDTKRTRFVVGLERPADFQVFSLSNPNRVIVELPDVKMQLPELPGGHQVGLVKSFRGGLSAPGRSRIVIDVAGPVVVEQAGLEKAKDGRSHQLALTIVPVDAAAKMPPVARKPIKQLASASGLGAVGLQPPLPKPAVRPEVQAAKAYKPIIVIDPGHGGHDSGAQKNGTVEKDVVLAFSKALRDKLEASGRYKVLMTRDTDVFVELDARRDFGEKHKAALFIAVHADYAGSHARGATIYSLRDSVASDLKRSAKGEVAENVLSAQEMNAVRQNDGDVGTVKGILAELATREVEVNMERTTIFSKAVIDTMGATTNMQNNPDRSAAFRVLKSAKVPSVLIELAYVTNEQDARNLRSGQWRDKVSGSILSAVDNYFSNQLARLPL